MIALRTNLAYEVRRATVHDLDFVMRAQEAIAYDLDPMPEAQVFAGLLTGAAEVYMLDVNEQPRMCLSVQTQGEKALIAGLYREGPAKGLLPEIRHLSDTVEKILRLRGITDVCVFVHWDNPSYDTLTAMYHRLGFCCDTTRMSRRL